MENTKQSAKEYLQSQGCNLNSFIIDYDVIARYLVEYAKSVQENDKPNETRV